MAEGNGSFVKEIQELLEQDKISSKDAQILTLKSMVRVLNRLDDVEERLKKNYMVALGAFMKDHPKLAALLGGILVILANLWFVSSFRESLLSLLGLPPEWLSFLDS